MADDDEGEAVFFLQAAEQFKDLLLPLDIKRAGWFVQYEDFRTDNDGAGDGEALALAAGECVRIAFEGIFGQADLFEDFLNAAAHFFARHTRLVNAQGFGNGIKDVHARIKCAERVLEHHLDFSAQFVSPWLAVDVQAAFGIDKVHNGFCQRGFAATAFADDAQCLPRFEIEGNGVENGFVAFFKPAV